MQKKATEAPGGRLKERAPGILRRNARRQGPRVGLRPLVPGLVLDYPENVVGIEDHVVLAI